MNNKLNYSTLEEAWGTNIVPASDYSYDKEQFTGNLLSVNKELGENIINTTINNKPNNVQTNTVPNNVPNTVLNNIQTNTVPTKLPVNILNHIEDINSCILIEEHLKNCKVCNNKFSKKKNKKYIRETFENITPNQKNLLIIIIYGILIILISDVLINDTDV